MNAPRAEANKSIAEVEKTAVSLSGILTGIDYLNFVTNVDTTDVIYVQCWFG